SLICFTTNEYRIRIKSMAMCGRGSLISYSDTFAICMSSCGNAMVSGISSANEKRLILLSHSPGRYTVSGVDPGCSLDSSYMNGRLLHTFRAGRTFCEIDLSGSSPGIYVLSVGGSAEGRRYKLLR